MRMATNAALTARVAEREGRPPAQDAGQFLRNRRRLRLADEIRYIQRRAAAHDGRVVTADQLILFSTKPATPGSSTRPTTSPRASPATAYPEPIAFEETDTSFKIAWPGNYHLDDSLRLLRSPKPSRLDHPRLPERDSSPPQSSLKFQIFRWHCHVGDFYLSTARSGHRPQTGKSMVWRAPAWYWTPPESLFLANVTMPLRPLEPGL